ncbi:MAG: type II secretion system protein GspK [Gammaproteobacteria bacterium]|nr:type II secretion system protein GspK [Gammaproteobacteria bacterium]
MAGFILAATLWALVALAVVAAYINGFTETNIDNAHRTKLMLQAELDRRSTEATLLYLLATNRMSPRSLLIEYEQRFSDLDTRLDDEADSELSVAGVRYAGLGDTAFSIQDENGLVSVNSPRDPKFAAMMKSVGVSAPDLARLIPRIADYIDRDDRLSLDGAETNAYREAEQPPPPNWFLQTPMELSRVLGAADLVDHGQWRRLRNMATPRLLVSVNFNTMPEDVVAAVLGVEREALDGFFAERAENRIRSVDQLLELTGTRPAFNPGLMATTPSYFLRLTTWWVGGGPRTVVGITLTPGSMITPWRTEYRYSEPVDRAASLEETQVPLLGGTAPDPV